MLSFFAATKIERQSWQDEKCAVKIQLANSYNPALNMGTIISFIAGEGGFGHMCGLIGAPMRAAPSFFRI